MAGTDDPHLTERQQYWLKHIRACNASGKTTIDYAGEHGIKASANLYSLIETAKASGLEPYQYLRQVFTELPQAETVEDIENLLPWALKKNPAEAI